jgi:pyridoxine 4-dehydrogenase
LALSAPSLEPFGQSPLLLPPAASSSCLGTWSWGNRLLYGYDESDDERIGEAYGAAVGLGVRLFDTGDSYGTGKLRGNAERLLRGSFERTPSDPPPVFLSKIAVYPWLLTVDSYYDAILASRGRLIPPPPPTFSPSSNPSAFTAPPSPAPPHFLPSLHWSPSSYLPSQLPSLLSALSRSYLEGHAPAVAVSNLGPSALLSALDHFQKRGVPVACNQLQCSLLADYERDVAPALRVAGDAGVATLGYSPLALGLLATPSGEPVRGARGLLFRAQGRDKGQLRLLEAMDEIGGRNGRTRSQVALAWVRAKGLAPLFGARSGAQVEDSAGGGGWGLAGEEMAELEERRVRVEKKAQRNVFLND